MPKGWVCSPAPGVVALKSPSKGVPKSDHMASSTNTAMQMDHSDTPVWLGPLSSYQPTPNLGYYSQAFSQ